MSNIAQPTHTSPLRIITDLSPIVDMQKTGIGYLAQALVNALARNPEAQIEGFYFNFLRRNQLNVPTGLNARVITLLPTKLMTLLQARLSWFLPLRFLMADVKSFDWALYHNYYAYPPPRDRGGGSHPRNVIFIHDTIFLDYPEEGNGWLRAALEKALRTCPLILCNSQYTRGCILRHFPQINPDDVCVIWVPLLPGVNTARDDHILSRHGLKPDSYLLFTGSVWPRKVGVLLDAYAQLPPLLRRNHPLVLVGNYQSSLSASVLDRVRALKTEDPQSRVILTGYISDAQRNALYANARLFIHPSQEEGFGMPLLEAMSFGCTILASDIEVFHEVAGGSVRYFDPYDADNLCRSLVLELETPCPVRQDQYAAILNKASWDDVAAQVIGFLQQHA